MFGSLFDRLPRLGRWPRLALVGCCLLLALDSALTAHAGTRAPTHGAHSIVVAARSLRAGAVIAGADVRLARWDGRSAPPSVVLVRRADAIGRRIVTATAPGEPISSTRLLGADLASRLAPGQVAVSVQVSDPHESDLVHAGDRVALYALARADDLPDGDAGTAASAHPAAVIATGLRVLAVLPSAQDAGDTATGELVVAASAATAIRVTQANLQQVVAAVGQSP